MDLLYKGLKVSSSVPELKWAGLAQVLLQSGESLLLSNILSHSCLSNAGQLLETSSK